MGIFDADIKKVIYIVTRIVIYFSFIVWLVTEGLSAFDLITSKAVTIVWGGIIFLFCSFLVISYKKGKIVKRNRLTWQHIKIFYYELSKEECLMLILGFCMAAGTFLIAYITVPFNWDSMTYHLARVGNWIENASVKHYPTNIERQLYYSSFTEYFILHICLIFKNDKLVNLVQWSCYVISAMMIYGISVELNFKRKTALFAVLLFMFCPLAIAESGTTQVDLAGTVWVLIFAYYVLLIRKRQGLLLEVKNLEHVVLCGAAIGFGYLTKASVCFLMPLYLLWILADCLKRKDKAKEIIVCCVAAAAVILILALPGFVRNYKSTGDVLAMDKMAGNLMIKTWNPKYILLNFCKNMTMEVAGIGEPDLFWSMTIRLADVLDVDIENSEISAYYGFSEGVVKRYTQDQAGAQMLFITVWILLVLLFMRWIYRVIKKLSSQYSEMGYIELSIGAAFVLFACIRWQPWVTRLLLPAIPFFCIFLACAAEKLKSRYMQTAFLSIMLIVMLPDAALAMKGVVRYMKPAIEKQERFYLYFLNRGEAKEYDALCEKIDSYHVQDIGLLLDGDTYEWPLWIKLKNEKTSLRHVVLETEDVTWYPECIAAIHRGVSVGEVLEYGEKEYECVWNYETDTEFAVLVER